MTRRRFDQIAGACFAALKGDEALTLTLAGENQHYIRFNAGRVRQSTQVEQRHLSLYFQSRGRRVVYGFDLTGHLEQDQRASLTLIARARAEAAVLPEDPFVAPVRSTASQRR